MKRTFLTLCLMLICNQIANANSQDDQFQESQYPQEIEYRQCTQDAYFDVDKLLVCAQKKAISWDKDLNKVYKEAQGRCSQKQDKDNCLQILKEGEKGFIQRKDNLIKVYLSDENSLLDRLRAKEVEANLLREQAVRLMGFVEDF